MKVHPRIEPLLYGIIVFAIFYILTLALKLITHQFPTVLSFETLFPKKDLLLGLGVSAVLTFTHQRKMKLK
jgi:hypothetical protein